MNNSGSNRTILDSLMHKLPSTRKHYHVRLVVPDSGIPFIDYRQVSNFVGTKKAAKAVQFVDLLFADKKHDTSERFAFSIYSIDKTITFLPQDETVMNEWLTKIRELHSNLYPEFKRYDSIFEAKLLNKGLATTMHIQGQYRLAVCKESIDLIPLLTVQNQQQNTNYKTPNSATSTIGSNIKSPSANAHHHNPHQDHHLLHHPETNLPNNFNSSYLQNQHHHSSKLNSTLLNQSQPHHHLPQHLPSHQRFCKRHPQLASKTIELVLRSIRRCGHTQAKFYIESGRHSQIGEGGLWMALDKEYTARQLHELLLATMKLASATDDQFMFKAPRSRSGSSSDNAHRSQQSRSSSLVCLNADLSSSSNSSSTVTSTTTITATSNIPMNINTTPSAISNPTSNSMQSSDKGNINGNNNLNGNFLSSLFGNQPNQQPSPASGTQTLLGADISQAAVINSISTIPMFPNHDNNIEEDSGYVPMA